MNDNIIAKIICSIIATIVMSFIVVFVFNYYDSEARNNDNNKKSSDTAVEVLDEVVSNITLSSFEFERTDIFLEKNRIILDVLTTDAGDVLVVNDEPLSYINRYSSIKYATFQNILVIDCITDEIENIYLVDKNVNIVNSFGYVYENGERYTVSNPLINDKYYSSLVINNDIYITYVLTNFGNQEYDSNLLIQFTYKVKTDGTFEVVSSYEYKDYKN